MTTHPRRDATPVADGYRNGTAEAFIAAPLPSPCQVSVAVVGGGITGLATAVALSESGVDTVVLEARHVGAGASGRAFGQVVPYAKYDQAALTRRFGAQAAPALIDLIASGPDRLFSFIQRHRIDCQMQRQGTLLAAHHRKMEPTVSAQARYWQQRGEAVELIDRDRIEALTGTRRYTMAMLDPRNGTVNGLGLSLGLARVATQLGAVVVENCAVNAAHRAGGGWRLVTDCGEVRADTLVLATNAYSDALWPGLAASVLPMRGYGTFTAALDADAAARILPHGHSLMDTRRLFSGIRRWADGRLHLSCDGPPFRIGAPDLVQARKRLCEVYPELAQLAFEEHWSGWIAIRPGMFPGLHRLADNAWAALGYSGRGISLGHLLGREIAAHILGARNEPPAFPVTPLRALPSRRGAQLYAQAMVALYRVLDRRELYERSTLHCARGMSTEPPADKAH